MGGMVRQNRDFHRALELSVERTYVGILSLDYHVNKALDIQGSPIKTESKNKIRVNHNMQKFTVF